MVVKSRILTPAVETNSQIIIYLLFGLVCTSIILKLFYVLQLAEELYVCIKKSDKYNYLSFNRRYSNMP